MAGGLIRGDVYLCECPRPGKPRPVRDVPSEVVLDVEDGMKKPNAAPPGRCLPMWIAYTGK